MLFKIFQKRRWIHRARSYPHSPELFSPARHSQFAPDARAMRHKPLCHSRFQRVACAQALLFGRAKRAARERGVNGEGPRLLWRPILDKIFLSSRHKFMPSRPLLISPIHRVNSSSRQVISLSRRVISSCRLYYLQVHYLYILQ